MIGPDLYQLKPNCYKKGLYESFYYRGNLSDGNKAFWLKHNLLMYAGDTNVRIECTVIVFNNELNTSKTYKHMEMINTVEYSERIIKEGESWLDLNYQFKNGSHMLIKQESLKGELILPGENSNVSWDLSLMPSQKSYYHFSNDWFYHGFFPKKKILTKDIHLGFDGNISTPEIEIEGKLIGMNGHNWGKEHAYKYSYGNCNQFKENQDAYFDGFSAKISLVKGIIKSPYLSGSSLKVDDKWYHFNNVLTSYKHKVTELLERKWRVTFLNKDHLLEVLIDGDHAPWAHLNYGHPSGKTSVVNNTKFATGMLVLKHRDSGKVISVLKSDFFELESLIS